MFQLILFYVFAAVILFSALQVVTTKNPVNAALYLVLTFCTSALMWVLMQAEFLGIILVVVYVGAVMVLFLFIVMMLNIDIEEMRKGFWKNLPVSGTIGVLFAVLLILILINPKTDLSAFTMQDLPADYSNIRALGSEIYTIYVLPFELAAVLLVLGIVAAIALVHRPSTNPRRQNPAEQVKVQAKDRFRMVNIPVVLPQSDEAQTEENDSKEAK